MTHLAWLILALPLFGSLTLMLTGGRLGKGGSAAVGVGSVSAAFVLAAITFFVLLARAPAARSIHEILYTWMAAPAGFHLRVGLLVDPLSLLFMLVITGVGALIHLYSVGYMGRDDAFSRFFAYMNLFVFAMLLLVMSDNFLFLLVGWGGVGLASYLLIGFWYQRPSAVQAAKKAFVVNVVGDVGMMIAIFLLYLNLGTVSYHGVFAAAGSLGTGALAFWIAILLYLGAAAKSAQFPLHVWLPDAMEGPTPVSALIHAATMVTAGVYLVARAYPLFHLSAAATSVVVDIAAFTAMFAAVIAITQYDIKRVLAYSTVSQLGYMFLGVGMGAYVGGLFHFLTHAFFKALLFLGAGSVIHAVHDEQDMRRMGGLGKTMPITYWTFMAAVLAISGIPGFSGFFSKDLIIGSLLETGHTVLWLVAAVTAGLTAFYMFRLFYLTFSGEPRGEKGHESPRVMTGPLVVLGVLSVVGGYLVLPGGWNALGGWLHPVFARYPGGITRAWSLPPDWASMIISVLLAVGGWYLAYLTYKVHAIDSVRVRTALGGLYTAAYRKFYIDEAGEWTLVRGALWLGRAGTWLDRGLMQGGVDGVGSLVREWGESLKPIQTGFVRRYALSILLGAVAVAAYFTLRA